MILFLIYLLSYFPLPYLYIGLGVRLKYYELFNVYYEGSNGYYE